LTARAGLDKLHLIMKRAENRMIFRSSLAGFASILLLHGLIAAPIFVRCVLANGKAVLEVFGQDPHQDCSAGPLGSHSGYVLTASYSEGVGPCTDMRVDNPAVLDIGISRLVQVSGANAAPDLLPPAAELEIQVLDIALHPITASAHHLSPSPSLRI